MVAAIKADGKILREFGEKVYIPFGKEYSILLKNINSQRAVVDIWIDGTKVTKSGLVLNSNTEFELERFIENLNAGNKFKFIERTSKVENNRGIMLEDGLIRIEFRFERKPVFYKPEPIILYDYERTTLRSDGYHSKSASEYASSHSTITMDAEMPEYKNTPEVVCKAASEINDKGITVKGSISEQKFNLTTVSELETDKHLILFQLVGKTDNNTQLTKPVTVKMKPKCITCGKVNKATSKFCSDCGTGLEIVV
jgi:hypothetical protein